MLLLTVAHCLCRPEALRNEYPKRRSAVFSRETTHTARKAHQCVGCLQTIAPGEKYVRWSGRTYGDFETAAYHEDCRGWEIFLCQEAALRDDEWQPLHEFVRSAATALTVRR